ncbi:extracellular solute-binding protein [Lacrimispora sp.]|uniref:extracellular solute-binding protein n=1 Tax=Lacrimispora sp. TaxID=2719234 RepID=UPI002FD8E7E0
MPTIKDIAKAAGVSHSTVSNVLNKKSGVSSEKIRLVQETARAMGYRIDEQASLLRKGVTRTVAVILPDIRSNSFCDLYVGILKSLENRSYSARLYLTDNMPYREKQAVDSAIAAKACAILAVTSLEYASSYYRIPSLEQTPILFLDRNPDSSSLAHYSFNYEEAGRIIAEHARKQGCTNPCVVTGNQYYSPNKDFLSGIRQIYPDLKAKDILEMKYGEYSTDAYLPFKEGAVFDSFLVQGAEFADQLYSACHTVGREPEPAFYTLTSLRAILDYRYHNLPLNYSNMGAEAANALLDSVEKKAELTSREFYSSQFYPKHSESKKSTSAPLRLLTLASPTSTALECLIPEFTRHTGIPVEVETHPLSTFYDNIHTNQALNCDIIRLDVSSFDYLAPSILEPLNNLDSDVTRQLERFIPGLTDNYGYVNGTLYALPFDISIQMLFYRKDLFEDSMQMRSYFEQTKHSLKVPETFEEYNETARFFTRKYRPDSPTAYGSSIALGTASSTASEYLVRLLGMGGHKLDERGLLYLSTQKAKKALKSYLETAEYADPAVIHSWNAVTENFIHGETAMAILFSNYASGIIRTQNALSSNQVGFAPVPGARPLHGGGTLGIYSGSSRKDDAYRFIQWATSDEIAARLMIMGGISPCRSGYEHVEVLNTYPWLQDFEKNLQMGSRKSIYTNQGIRLDMRKFEVSLGQLVIDAAGKKRPVNETLWRAQQLIEEMAP